MATLTAEPAQLDRLTLLASGGETAGVFKNPISWARGQEAIRISNELKKVQPIGGKDTIARALAIKEGERKLNLHNVPNFVNRFGGEHTSDPTHMTPEERASRIKASDVISQNAVLALFLQTKGLPPGDRTAYVDKMTREYGMPLVTYDVLRHDALMAIAANPDFISLFPEVPASFGTPPNPAVLAFIESTLIPGDDQRLAARLGTRMQEAYKKAVGLPPVGTDEERATVEKQIEIDKRTIDVRSATVLNDIISKGIRKPGGGDYTLTDIKDILNTSGPTDVAAENIVRTLFLKANPTLTLAQFNSMKEYADLPGKISQSEANITSKLVPPVIDIPAFIAANPGDPDVRNLTSQRASKVGYDAHYGSGSPHATQFRTFNSRFNSLLNESGFRSIVQETRDAQIRLEDAKIKKAVLPPTTADVERSRDLRILQEEDLLGEIDGILGQSLKDVLEERYDVMEERMGRLTEQQEKEKDITTKRLTMKLKQKMSANWISYIQGNREKQVNKKQIREDVTHLAYAFDKDVALKQLIARDLFGDSSRALLTQYQRINVVDGTDMLGSHASMLDADQLEQLNKVFESAGTEYRDKLFADMFAARTFADRTIDFGRLGGEKSWGKLGFKRDEWKYMMQRYEPEITKALESNHEASQALKTLEVQGVKTNFSTKWLMYILAIVFGLGTGGAATALIPGLGIAGGGIGAAAGVGAELAAAKAMNRVRSPDVNGNLN